MRVLLADRCSVLQQLGALQTHTIDTFLFISHTTNVILFNYERNAGFGSEWDTLYKEESCLKLQPDQFRSNVL